MCEIWANTYQRAQCMDVYRSLQHRYWLAYSDVQVLRVVEYLAASVPGSFVTLREPFQGQAAK